MQISMKTLSLTIALTTFVTALLPAQRDTRPVAETENSVVRVGTWNLEHFGNRKPPRTAAQIEMLGAFIRSLRVDVLAVQEVNGAEPLETLCAEIGPSWRFVVGSTGGFRGEPTRIAVGFLWNDATVELVHAEDMLHLPSQAGEISIFHRKPVNAVFRARGTRPGIDFRAITVHLKASRGPKNEAKRSAEVAALAEYLETLRKTAGEDDDVFVLGDFNHTYAAPAHEKFTEDRSIRYLRPASGSPRTIVHFPEPIDHVAVTTGMADVLSGAHVTVHADVADQDLDAWRATYSDHIPVTVDLRAGPDQDPDATFTPPREGQALTPSRSRAEPTTAAASTSTFAHRAPAPVTDTLPRRFARGSEVQVVYTSSNNTTVTATQSVRGTLLHTPDDWVYLASAGGEVVAIPAHRVIRISGPAKPVPDASK